MSSTHAPFDVRLGIKGAAHPWGDLDTKLSEQMNRGGGGKTILDLLSGGGVDAMANADSNRSEVDGLLVHPLGGLPGFVPTTDSTTPLEKT